MKDMKISTTQIFWLITISVYTHTVLIMITPAVTRARQDAWISMLLAGGIGIAIAYLASKLSGMFPNQTMVEYMQTILGKWLGKLFMIPYLVMWYIAIAFLLRHFSDVVQTMLLNYTPIWVILTSMLFVVIYAALEGIEVVARCCQLVGPIIYGAVLVLIVLLFPEMRSRYLLPVFTGGGLLPIVKGAMPPASMLGESVLITMLTAFMTDPKQAVSSAIWGTAVASLSLSLGTVAILCVMPPEICSKMLYPAFEAVKYVDVGNFIQNLHSIVLIVWLLGIFIKISMYFFIATYGTAQWLGIKKWKYLIIFVTAVSVLLSFIPGNNVESEIILPEKIWVSYVFPVNMIAIPVLLWIVASLKQKIRGQR